MADNLEQALNAGGWYGNNTSDAEEYALNETERLRQERLLRFQQEQNMIALEDREARLPGINTFYDEPTAAEWAEIRGGFTGSDGETYPATVSVAENFEAAFLTNNGIGQWVPVDAPAIPAAAPAEAAEAADAPAEDAEAVEPRSYPQVQMVGQEMVLENASGDSQSYFVATGYLEYNEDGIILGDDGNPVFVAFDEPIATHAAPWDGTETGAELVNLPISEFTVPAGDAVPTFDQDYVNSIWLADEWNFSSWDHLLQVTDYTYAPEAAVAAEAPAVGENPFDARDDDAAAVEDDAAVVEAGDSGLMRFELSDTRTLNEVGVWLDADGNQVPNGHESASFYVATGELIAMPDGQTIVMPYDPADYTIVTWAENYAAENRTPLADQFPLAGGLITPVTTADFNAIATGSDAYWQTVMQTHEYPVTQADVDAMLAAGVAYMEQNGTQMLYTMRTTELAADTFNGWTLTDEQFADVTMNSPTGADWRSNWSVEDAGSYLLTTWTEGTRDLLQAELNNRATAYGEINFATVVPPFHLPVDTLTSEMGAAELAYFVNECDYLTEDMVARYNEKVAEFGGDEVADLDELKAVLLADGATLQPGDAGYEFLVDVVPNPVAYNPELMEGFIEGAGVDADMVTRYNEWILAEMDAAGIVDPEIIADMTFDSIDEALAVLNSGDPIQRGTGADRLLEFAMREHGAQLAADLIADARTINPDLQIAMEYTLLQLPADNPARVALEAQLGDNPAITVENMYEITTEEDPERAGDLLRSDAGFYIYANQPVYADAMALQAEGFAIQNFSYYTAEVMGGVALLQEQALADGVVPVVNDSGIDIEGLPFTRVPGIDPANQYFFLEGDEAERRRSEAEAIQPDWLEASTAEWLQAAVAGIEDVASGINLGGSDSYARGEVEGRGPAMAA